MEEPFFQAGIALIVIAQPADCVNEVNVTEVSALSSRDNKTVVERMVQPRFRLLLMPLFLLISLKEVYKPQ